MARTKAQVVTYCAELMGLIGTTDTETSDMTTDLGLAFDQLYAELERKQLIEFASSSVPDEYVEDIACMMAIRRSHRWDIPDNNYQRIALRVGADGKKGEMNLKEIMATTWAHQTVPALYM